MATARFDLLILGGGLAGGLAALAVTARRPELRVGIVEAGETLGGNHVWSFFASDIDPADRELVDPLIVHRWNGYDVHFPAHRRSIDEPYHSLTSERLDSVVRAALPAESIVRGVVAEASPTCVTLDDGRRIEAAAVLDTRGAGDLSVLSCGWQKFVGQVLTTDQPHGIDRPTVMDATVDQAEGFRFVYVLPFGTNELFVEDTYYSDTSDLDVAALRARIADYASARGWKAKPTNHVETGVLPVVMSGDFDDYWPASDGVARGGVRAGLFHPLTSYSLPDAVRFASWLSREAPIDGRLAKATRQLARRHWSRGWFDRLLTRMLFKAAAPRERYRILERFYRLPAPLIARFYAGRSTVGDRMRILAGKPPVPILKALRAMIGQP
ncbi:lycopene beta-cyclase CrtY [Sphingomonas sp. LY160]|uniref:lycopene beta-cyclase CrtY n=1 Tax=Sphingomonas sp. LY160 TaxID=3095342 RepID=UPI002ADEEB1B|nr:lycopene beta-cyclase CrtY [Sphingomonas sp. LY160]MEA1072944.1 lycopene beta-cyclase CrtY [Sphingomonas sp. LY160]